jgi:hypothetical protein
VYSKYSYNNTRKYIWWLQRSNNRMWIRKLCRKICKGTWYELWASW